MNIKKDSEYRPHAHFLFKCLLCLQSSSSLSLPITRLNSPTYFPLLPFFLTSYLHTVSYYHSLSSANLIYSFHQNSSYLPSNFTVIQYHLANRPIHKILLQIHSIIQYNLCILLLNTATLHKAQVLYFLLFLLQRSQSKLMSILLNSYQVSSTIIDSSSIILSRST